jgi:adenylosuccinate synthase
VAVKAAAAEHTCVVGLGWGDEGKGKVVDLLACDFDVVVRYNGGANAGHTVCIGGETFALHLIPAGVLHDGVVGLIGPGVVVDPSALLTEIDALAARGIRVAHNLKISDRAHVVTAYHKIEDQLSELAASKEQRIGTTARGIGPCYADKMRRRDAIRVCDLRRIDSLRERLGTIVRTKKAAFRAMYGDDGGLDADAVGEELTLAAERILPFACDTTEYLRRALHDGRRLLFEGANGMLLDIDHGTFPFVTSSSTGPYGVPAGAGVPPGTVTRVIGVTKAYATRVGAGPFVTELTDATGDRIRERGREFGTTTGRPRRCGWFDAVATRYSVHLGGVTEIALLHLDTLGGMSRVAIGVAYERDGRRIDTMEADPELLDCGRPVYEEHPGWPDGLASVPRFEDLPSEAIAYVQRVEELAGVPITIIGVGRERSQTLHRPKRTVVPG